MKPKESKIKENQSRAKKINILLKNYDKRFGSYQEMANFKEPVALLMRNTRRTEWFDDVTSGWFQFVHTDGSTRKIKLSPEFLMGLVAEGIMTVRFTYREGVIRIFGAGYWRKGKRIYEQENHIH